MVTTIIPCCWSLVTGHWSLVTGHWSLVTGWSSEWSGEPVPVVVSVVSVVSGQWCSGGLVVYASMAALRCFRAPSWLLRHQPVRYSGTSAPSSIGYECAAFADRDYDLSLLERSVRHGTCTLVVEKSRAADAVRTYDLLMDLASSDDVDLQRLSVVHVLAAASTGSEADVAKEVDAVRSALRSKPLTAVLVPIGGTADVLAAAAAATAGTGTVVGLDLPTEWLAAATTDDVDKFLATLSSSNDIRNGCGMLSVATNAFTHRHAARVFAWARAAGVPTIATELLRCHPRRPGLLSVAGGRQKLTHLDPTAEGFTMNRGSGTATPTNISTGNINSGSDSPSHAQLAAVEAVKHALNACVHAEKQFLERFQQDAAAGVDAQAVCWGHILSHTQHTILYPEEWDYFHAQQVQPRLSAALERLKSQGRAQHEWTLLYGPLAKHLFASFAATLEARRLALCADTHHALLAASGNSSGSGGLKTLPWALAGAALSLGSLHAAIAGTDIATTGGDTDTAAAARRALVDGGRKNSAAAYEGVHQVLAAYANSD